MERLVPARTTSCGFRRETYEVGGHEDVDAGLGLADVEVIDAQMVMAVLWRVRRSETPRAHDPMPRVCAACFSDTTVR